MPDNWLRRIAEGVFINGLYDLLKVVLGGAVVALGVALWRILKHIPIDWWGIFGLFGFVCIVFLVLMLLHRQQPKITPVVVPPVTEPLGVEPPKPSVQAQKRIPRIVGKTARMTRVNDIGTVFSEPDEGVGEHKAVIAEFRNEPDGASPFTWHHVRASIAYFDENQVEVSDVGSALWLERPTSIVDLKSQITLKLLVAIYADTWVTFDGSNFSPNAIKPGVKRARIILQDDRSFSLPFILEVDLAASTVGSLTSLTPPE